MAAIEFHKTSAYEREAILRKIDEALGDGIGKRVTRDMELVIAS
jgi:hypothetical protein